VRCETVGAHQPHLRVGQVERGRRSPRPGALGDHGRVEADAVGATAPVGEQRPRFDLVVLGVDLIQQGQLDPLIGLLGLAGVEGGGLRGPWAGRAQRGHGSISARRRLNSTGKLDRFV